MYTLIPYTMATYLIALRDEHMRPGGSTPIVICDDPPLAVPKGWLIIKLDSIGIWLIFPDLLNPERATHLKELSTDALMSELVNIKINARLLTFDEVNDETVGSPLAVETCKINRFWFVEQAEKVLEDAKMRHRKNGDLITF